MERLLRANENLWATLRAIGFSIRSLGGTVGPREIRYLAVLVCLLSVGCSLTSDTSVPRDGSVKVSISPDLLRARSEGFHLLAGHPPFTVDFSGTVEQDETLSYAWDFNEDGNTDSDALDPEPFTYTEPGEYEATLRVDGANGELARAKQRIVVIGPPKWPDWRYGVAAHLNRSHGLYHNDAETQRSAKMISDAGIEAVRVDWSWSSIQPETRDQFQWADYDYLVRLSKEHNYDLLPVLGYGTEWASTVTVERQGQDQVTAPPAPQDYAWFAYRATERYRNSISAWEIWNEPNSSGNWYPAPDPGAYATLLRSAYLAIKYADPDAPVVLGGLANTWTETMPPEQFLLGVYNAGGGGYFDAVGRHPYAYGWIDIEGLDQELDTTRAVMIDNGDSEKPIWVTEFGNSAVLEATVTDQTQGMWLAQALDEFASVDYVPVAFWYNFREKGTDPNNYEDNFGLVENDWTIKPAYEAYKNYIAATPNTVGWSP